MTFEVRVTANARRDRDRVIAWFDENHPDQSDRFIEDYLTRYHLWCRIVEDSDVVYVLAVNCQGRDPERLNRRFGLA